MSNRCGSEADFGPLIRLLQNIQKQDLETLEEQEAAFERELLSYELDPSCLNWVELKYSMGTAVAWSQHLQGKAWEPGREDLAPLFDLEELRAS